MSTELTEEMDTAEAVRRAAWDRAVSLYRQWDREQWSGQGGAGGGGYRCPVNAQSAVTTRTLLDELIQAHGFTGTWVDPAGPSWVARQSLSAAYPGPAA